MIATNIALVAAGKRPDRVVLVDLDLQFRASPRTRHRTEADAGGSCARRKRAEGIGAAAGVRRQARHGPCACSAPHRRRARGARHAGRRREHPRNVDQRLRPRDRRRGIGARRAHDAGPRVGRHRRDPGLPVPAWSVHSLLDFLNEGQDARSKTVFVLNNAFAREILKPATSSMPSARRSHSTCPTTRSCTSRPSTRACRSSSGRPTRRRQRSSSSWPALSSARTDYAPPAGPNAAACSEACAAAPDR